MGLAPLIGAGLLACLGATGVGVAAGAVWRRLHAGAKGASTDRPLLESTIALALLVLAAALVTVGLHIAWTGRVLSVDTPGLEGPALLAALSGTAAGHLALLGWARCVGAPLALRRASLVPMAIGAVSGAMTVAVSTAYVEAAARLGHAVSEQDIVRAALEGRDDGVRTVTLLFIVLVAPLLEELVFRGYLHAVLERRGGRWLAAGGTTLLFTVFHAADPQVLAPIAVLALVLSALRLRSGSVWPGVVAHVVNNGLALAFAGGLA